MTRSQALDLDRLPPLPVEYLSLEEELDLARRYHAGDQAAGDLLVERNLRWAVKQAWKYSAYEDIEDLVQEAWIGLIKALRKFDPERGYKFSTYATAWIRQSCTRSIQIGSQTISAKPAGWERYMYARRRLPADATYEQLLEKMQERKPDGSRMSKATARAALDTFRLQPLSLDASPPGADTTAVLADVVGDDGAHLEDLEDASFRQAVGQAVAELEPQLNDRERLILRSRLFSTDPMTLQEIAVQVGVTRERIRQIENGLKLKLRCHLIKTTNIEELAEQAGCEEIAMPTTPTPKIMSRQALGEMIEAAYTKHPEWMVDDPALFDHVDSTLKGQKPELPIPQAARWIRERLQKQWGEGSRTANTRELRKRWLRNVLQAAAMAGKKPPPTNDLVAGCREVFGLNYSLTELGYDRKVALADLPEGTTHLQVLGS